MSLAGITLLRTRNTLKLIMPTPPTVLWTFHGSALVHDYDAAVKQLGRLIGLRPIEFSDSTDPLIARKGGMTWIADNSIELVQPTVPSGGPAKMLARNGPGMFCFAVHVSNLKETTEWFDHIGVKWVGSVEGCFIFTHPKDTAGIYLEWSQMDGRREWEPRFGAKVPPVPGKPLINVMRIDHWGAIATDPETTFNLMQKLWPAPVLWKNLDAPHDKPYTAFWAGDGVFALYRCPESADEMERLWGIRDVGPRQHLMSLYVDDLKSAEAVFKQEGIRILRGSAKEGLIITHPADLHGIIIAWTDKAVGHLAP